MIIKKKTKRAIEYILIIFFLIIIIFSTYKIIIWSKENNENKKEKEEIQSYVTIENEEVIANEVENEEVQEKETVYKVDFEALKRKNPDTIGWLKVNNTSIEYPVVRGDANNFYTNHSFDKSKNSAGWIFTDPRDNLDGEDKNIVIFGHNRRDRSMFGSLSDVFKKEWYSNESNLRIKFITENENSIYQIFSTYTIEAEEDFIEVYFDETEDYESYLNKCLQRSSRDFNIEVKANDKIITLCTCANDNNYRVIVHAKKI